MRPAPKLLSVAILTALVLVSGCSDQKTGNATSTSPATPSTPRLPRDGAPAVANPITDTAKAEAEPCTMVSTSQIEEIGGKVEKALTDDGSFGKSCGWIFEEGPSNVNAGLVVGNKDGLSSLYAQNARGGLTTFKPVDPIDGYPAVVYANGGEGKGRCTLAVGVRDDLTYTIITLLSDANPLYSDPCGMAMKVAAAAIKNFKGA